MVCASFRITVTNFLAQAPTRLIFEVNNETPGSADYVLYDTLFQLCEHR